MYILLLAKFEQWRYNIKKEYFYEVFNGYYYAGWC